MSAAEFLNILYLKKCWNHNQCQCDIEIKMWTQETAAGCREPKGQELSLEIALASTGLHGFVEQAELPVVLSKF